MAKVFQVNTASGGSLTTSLVSYYKFTADATDFYGGVNGTGANVTYDSNGASFNGTSSYITAAAPNFGSAYTIAFWSTTNFNNLTDTNQRIWIDTTAGGSPNRPFLFYYEQGAHKFGWNSGGANVIDPFATSYGNISGQLHHWIFRWTTTTAEKVYYDGAEVESGTATITTGQPTNIIFGANQSLASSWFAGTIKEVGIWNKAISADEITDIYNGGTPQTMIDDTPAASSSRMMMGIGS